MADRFSLALKYIENSLGKKQFPDRPELSNDNKLKFYGLFKQATVGPCTTTKPGIFDPVGRAKWNAWNDLGDMSAEEAKKQYCLLLDSLAPGWDTFEELLKLK